jgi:hypothetical protein
MAVIALDDSGASLLIVAYDFPQVFRVELGGERGRPTKVWNMTVSSPRVRHWV